MEHKVLDPETRVYQAYSFLRNFKAGISRFSKNVTRSLKSIFSSSISRGLNKVVPLNAANQQTGISSEQIFFSEDRHSHDLKSPPTEQGETPVQIPLDDAKSCASIIPELSSNNLSIDEKHIEIHKDGIIIEESPPSSIRGRDPLSVPMESGIRLKTNRKCLVLDLDETLIHSSFNIPTVKTDFILKLDLSSSDQQSLVTDVVYVSKRPGLDGFLEEISKHFEVVVFTASLPSYANPVIDRIDPEGKYIHHRLFRHSCIFVCGHFIKDLTIFGKPLHDIIIVDNSPISYMLQPQNAIAIPTWFSDPHDRYLSLLCPELIKASTAEMPISSLSDVNSILQEEAMNKGVSISSPSAIHGNFAAILEMLSSPFSFPQTVEKF